MLSKVVFSGVIAAQLPPMVSADAATIDINWIGPPDDGSVREYADLTVCEGDIVKFTQWGDYITEFDVTETPIGNCDEDGRIYHADGEDWSTTVNWTSQEMIVTPGTMAEVQAQVDADDATDIHGQPLKTTFIDSIYTAYFDDGPRWTSSFLYATGGIDDLFAVATRIKTKGTHIFICTVDQTAHCAGGQRINIIGQPADNCTRSGTTQTQYGTELVRCDGCDAGTDNDGNDNGNGAVGASVVVSAALATVAAIFA